MTDEQPAPIPFSARRRAPALERMIVAAWLPNTITAAEVVAVLRDQLGAARVDVYAPPDPPVDPPRCLTHSEPATAFTEGAWRCPRCPIDGGTL